MATNPGIVYGGAGGIQQSVTPTQQQSFVQSDLGYATAAAQATGNSPAEVLGQWALETGWGAHYAGANNPGNVMNNGVAVNYPTMSAGVGAYVSTLQSEGVTGQAMNPSQFATDLQNAGYGGTQSNYGQSVLNTIASVPASVNNSYGNSNLNNLSSTNPSVAQSGLLGLQATSPLNTNAASNIGCPSFSISDPMPWLKCNAGNSVLIFFGLVIVGGAIWALLNKQITSAAGAVASTAVIGE